MAPWPARGRLAPRKWASRALRPAHALLALGALALGGCIPAPLGRYYQPRMDSTAAQRYTGTECHGQAGAPAVLHLDLGQGVKLRVDALRPRGAAQGQGRPLHLTLDIPRGATVQWDSASAQLSMDGGRTWRDLPLHASVSAERKMPWRVDMAQLAPTPVAAIRPGSFHANASLDYSVAGYVPRRFELEMPAMRMAGKTASVAMRIDARAQQRPESYKGEYRTHHSLIYTTPESRARLARRLAACQAEVRAGVKGLHCDNLRIYDDARFERSEGPFRVSGRWYVFDVEGGTPFQGEMHVQYQAPLDWSFVRRALVLRDPNGATRSIAPSCWTLYLGYDIAPATPVRGVNDAPHAPATSLSMRADLGEAEAARYLVRLPELRIDGKRLQLPLLELARHLLDFGLEPFNC